MLLDPLLRPLNIESLGHRVDLVYNYEESMPSLVDILKDLSDLASLEISDIQHQHDHRLSVDLLADLLDQSSSIKVQHIRSKMQRLSRLCIFRGFGEDVVVKVLLELGGRAQVETSLAKHFIWSLLVLIQLLDVSLHFLVIYHSLVFSHFLHGKDLVDIENFFKDLLRVRR